jgi:hypothetical protein
MSTCSLGYGDQPYGGDFYGTGQLSTENGIMPRDIVLFDSNSDGTVNTARPITYVPSAVSAYQIDDLTDVGKDLFSDVNLDPYNVYLTYHKLWMVNTNGVFTFREPKLSIISASDIYGFIALAKTINGLPVPTDGNEMNVGYGNGPGSFGIAELQFNDLVPGDGVSFWIRRRVMVDSKKRQIMNHQFKITGKTDLVGEHCTT